LINVIHAEGYHSGYSIAGTNIKNIISSRYSNCFSNINLKSGINIFIRTPPFSVNSEAYNIGAFYWETLDFPKSWVNTIRTLDEFWAPCDLVIENLKRIGFKGKIFKIPTPILSETTTNEVILSDNKNQQFKRDFMFYSISEWNYRKGFDILLKAYLREFSNENVGLFIKTSSPDSKLLLKFHAEILEIKSEKDKQYPNIFFCDSRLSYQDLTRIHNTFDCFVLPHRGEGWGMTIHEAINSYSPVITTKFGGITDFLTEDSSYFVNYSMKKTKNMEAWGDLYEDKMWAEPSPESLQEKMRQAFEDGEAFHKKKLLSKSIAQELSYENISKIILDRLEVIGENTGLV
jgi:glycosyltransferase involved in cell wall biosynthesis